MAAQKRQWVAQGRVGALLAPLADRFARQPFQQRAALAVAPVVGLLQRGHVIDLARQGLGFEQPFQSSAVLAQTIEHHRQQVEAGKSDIGVAHIAFCQIAQEVFRLPVALRAMHKERAIIKGGLVFRIARQAGLGLGGRLPPGAVPVPTRRPNSAARESRTGPLRRPVGKRPARGQSGAADDTAGRA